MRLIIALCAFMCSVCSAADLLYCESLFERQEEGWTYIGPDPTVANLYEDFMKIDRFGSPLLHFTLNEWYQDESIWVHEKGAKVILMHDRESIVLTNSKGIWLYANCTLVELNHP